MKSLIIITLVLIGMDTLSIAQEIIPLYEGEIPNSKPGPDQETTEIRDGITVINKISRPTLSIYLPDNKEAITAAVIVVPGGGYWVNASSHEGSDVAKEFVKRGIAAFVVKYRIPSDSTMVNKEIGPLQDAQQAILLVRKNAAKWHINPKQIGIMGFSAGGHLASTAGTHFNKEVIENKDKISLRPDFMMLIYPVISFRDDIGHRGSRDQLIGKKPSKEKIAYYSNELHITKDTPPTFLVHASDDDVVPVANSVVFYDGLLKNEVPTELHIYQKGGHGFGMTNKSTHDNWMPLCFSWMKVNGWIKN